MKHSEFINDLATALVEAQGELEDAAKDATNPHFRNEYATLSSVLKEIRPVFKKHGLAMTQVPWANKDSGLVLTTMIMHKSGQWISGDLELLMGKQDMQGMGSSLSYGRRYAASAMALISQQDDDGNEASAQAPKKQEAKPTAASKASQNQSPVTSSKKLQEPAKTPEIDNHAPIGMARSVDLKTKIKELSATWDNEKIDQLSMLEYGKQPHELIPREAQAMLNYCKNNPFTKGAP